MTTPNDFHFLGDCLGADGDISASDQAELGWLNSRCRVKATRLIDVDNLLAAVVGRLGGRFDQQHRDTAQLKVTGFAEGRISEASLHAARRPVQQPRQSLATATDIELIVHARLAIAPEQLEQEVRTAVGAVAEEFGGQAAFGETSSFHPNGPGATPRPVEAG